jgi:hypothetical protein
MSQNRNTISSYPGQNRVTEKLPPIQQQRATMGTYQREEYIDENAEEINYPQNGGSYQNGRAAYETDNRPFVINAKNAGTLEFDCSGGRPLQLITADPKSKQFDLNTEAVQELVEYEGNVAFVTVAGKYRTGKSFLLNKLLGIKGPGFRVDPTTSSCTQGIWIWSKPIYIEKDNLYLFFMDTEGSNSVEKSASHDAKIFALSILMSSFFVYNSVGVIDENSINELSLTTQLSKNIAVSAEEGAASDLTLSYYTPKFLWLLRDFTLELLDAKGKPITPQQYLENALTDQSTVSKTSETNRKIRQALLNFFKDRDCITAVRPVNEEFALQKLDRLQDGQIRPEFLNQLKRLKEKILSKITPKQLKGVNLTPKMYFAMVEKYVEAINNGAVPTISTAWEHLVETECQTAFEAAWSLFEEALRKFLFDPEIANEAKAMEDLYHILKNIRDKTLEKYNMMTASFERHPKVQEYKEKLKEYLDQKEDQVFQKNEEMAQGHNEELISELAALMTENLSKGFYGEERIELYCNDFNEMATQFDLQARGVNKTRTLIAFLGQFNRKSLASVTAVLSKRIRQLEAQLSASGSKDSLLEQELKAKIAELQNAQKIYEESVQKLRSDKEKLNATIAQLEREKNQNKEFSSQVQELKIKNVTLEKKEEDNSKEKQKLEVEIKELNERINKKKSCCTIF